jgi:hypothetical protein
LITQIFIGTVSVQPPPFTQVEEPSGNSSSIRLLGQVGSFSSVSLSQAAGSMPFSLAVASRLWMAAARRPARSEPVNSQFLRFCQDWHNKNYPQSEIMLSSPVPGFVIA